MRNIQNPMRGVSLAAILLCLTVGSVPVVCAQANAADTGIQTIDSIAVIVNDDVITHQELIGRLRSVVTRMKSQNIALPPPEDFQRQVIESMIVERVQLQKAKESGIVVDDIMLDRSLNRIAEQNKMTLQQLRDQVEREGTSFGHFREEMREEITMQRLRQSAIDNRILVSDTEVDSYLASESASLVEKMELNLAQILVRIPENSSPEQIAARRVRAEEALTKLRSGTAFEKVAASYSDASDALSGGEIGWRNRDRLPQLFNDAVSKLKKGEVSALIKSPNGFHILKVVDQRVPATVATGEVLVQQSRVRHILIKVNQVVSSFDAQTTLAGLKTRLDNKDATFEALAKQFSGDASAAKGGDLGWLHPGDTVPEFEKAMNALKIGQVSEPIETPFGFHLIEVLERKTDDVSKERKRNAARQALRERKTEESVQEWVGQLRDRAYVEYRLEEK